MVPICLVSDSRETVAVVRGVLGTAFRIDVLQARRGMQASSLPQEACIVWDMDSEAESWRSILRETRASATVNVVLVTAEPCARDIVEAVQLGATDVVDRVNDWERIRPAVLQAVGTQGVASFARQSSRLEVLTPRQKEILRLASTGMTSKAIASRLYLSKRTVDAHRARMVKRLGATCFLDLIREHVLSGQARLAVCSLTGPTHAYGGQQMGSNQ